MREISFYKVKGQLYGKVAASSFRENGTVHKRNDGIYLGRVIDKNNNIFWNKTNGIFKFNPETATIEKADETYVSELPDDQRKRPKVLLDFGDSYILSEILRKMKYDEVINSISYRNKDTLNAMVQYYVLQDKANSHAKIWYDGSIASILYPKADLNSQRISDFLRSIGKIENVQSFFDTHIRWVMNNICSDPAVLIDSTGLPNNIHFPLTAVSNHNGKVSREVRMTTMVQRDSGYPLMFRITPGNIVDVSTITYSVQELMMHNVKTDFAIVDAGYFTDENIDQLYHAGIDFLTRLPARNRSYCQEIIDSCLPNLRKEENLVKYEGRYVYLKQKEIKIGVHKNHTAYAYLGYDIARASDETHKALARAVKDNTDLSALQKKLDDAGLFIIISSLPFSCEEILPTYYIRQTIEQYFDIEKGASKLTPLRIQDEDALMGHLVLSMIAATINIYIMHKLDQYYEDREAMFMSLRNEKCLVYRTQVNPMEIQAAGADIYKKFGIRIPIHLQRTDHGLLPKYSPGSES